MSKEFLYAMDLKEEISPHYIAKYTIGEGSISLSVQRMPMIAWKQAGGAATVQQISFLLILPQHKNKQL